MLFKGLIIIASAFGLAIGGNWSACTKLCGGGTKMRIRACLFGPFCSRQESVFCNTQPCAPSNFDEYTACSKACGGGYWFKVKYCSKYNDVNLCPKTYEECNIDPCPKIPLCPYNEVHRYGTKSSCCSKSTESCGVPNPLILGTGVRVIGGKDSVVGEWPWMAVIVIRNSKTTRCSGSLIHKDYILTAAHCLTTLVACATFGPRIEKIERNQGFSVNTSLYYVLLGSTKIKFPEAIKQKLEIEAFILHEFYSPPHHDIGLVKLKTSASFNDYVKPICLPNNEELPIDTTCVAAGWGIASKADINAGIPSDSLKHVSLRHLPKDACVEGLKGITWKAELFSSDENLCFGILSGDKDTCNGDSGGPVMCQRCSSCGWYVAGVTSYGTVNCGTAGKPSVYMHVKNYESWIRRIIPGITKNSFSCKAVP